MMSQKLWTLALVALVFAAGAVRADSDDDELKTETVDNDLGSQRDGSRTDSEVKLLNY